MFNQSLSIENEVRVYRQNRIDFYRNQEDTEDYRYSKFLLFHIIPDTFNDSTYRKNLFFLQRQNPNLKFSSIFDGTGCDFRMQPNVDGIRYPGNNYGMECLLNNSCIAECFFPLYECLDATDRFPNGYFPSEYIWNKLEPVIRQYTSIMKNLLESKRVFIGISILGCKNVASENHYETFFPGSIDRNTIICNPITIENIDDVNEIEASLKWLQIEYSLALGIKSSKKLKELIDDVTGANEK